MALLDRFRTQRDGEEAGYEALRIDGDMATTLNGEYPRDAITVRPHKSNGGIEAMDEVLESLHTLKTESPRFRRTRENVSPAHAFEMRYAASTPTDERTVTLQCLTGSDALDGTFERQLQNQYPDSQIDRTAPTFLPASDGHYIAGATLGLRRYTLYPIRNVDLPGFQSDPTGSILQEMVGAHQDDVADAAVVVQIMFKPAARTWTAGVPNGDGIADADDPNVSGTPGIRDLTYNLRQPTFERRRKVFTWETIEHPPSKVDKEVATLLESQQGQKGWHLLLRVFALSADPSVAVARASTTAGMFRNFYESNSEQTFLPQPLTDTTLQQQAQQAAARTFEQTGIVKSQREVAGLINIPEAQYVNTNKLRWSLSRPGEGIPPGTPRFDFEAAGVDDGTPAEKQVAMLAETAPDAPYWYGFGSRYGIEAGVDADILNVHQFVGGGTGKGKTTWLTNFASQIMRRGHGALIFDPKGKDADEFIREWPADRPEEDFIFVDLSDDLEKQVRFNFLEVPSDGDPGSRAFASAVEALCDDLVAMIAQAGGSDNYWGALMNRVARTLIRGMAKSDRTCTLLDLACCCTAPANRARFAEWMSEERIHFIEDAAQRIREKEDSDLEPLAGRLDQWVQNDAIRNLIAARESTVSIQDAVEDGKVIVVRNDPASGETEKRLFATALIRRAWVAAREAEDAPPFYVICDEFDSIVTEESNIHRILSEARAFDFCLTLACQNPSNQLPEQVAKAIENQCETFISFNPGGRDDARLIAAQHSPNVDWEDLTNISKYTFYMRTHDDNNELTHSYKVDAFLPISEVRRAVTGKAGMTDDELAAFKRRSVERYGVTPASAIEQKAESHFYNETTEKTPGTPPTVQHDLDMHDSRCRNQALKAVYDESIRQGTPGGWVRVAACVDRLQRYLPGGEVITDPGKAWRKVLQEIPDPYLDRREVDDEMQVKPLDTGFLNLGDSENDGTAEHWAPMADAYVPMTQLGFIFEIPEQTGDAMPDGLARLDDVLSIEPDDDPETIADTVNSYRENHALLHRLAGTKDAYIESEHTTGSTQPSQTVKNLAQAHNAGHRCLFFAREEVAEKVYETVENAPFCCRSSHPDEGERRFYTDTQTLRIDDAVMTRPGGRENVWVYDEQTGEYVLRDNDGTVHARFDSAADIFTDASAYPDGGERTIKPPVIPEYEMDGDLSEVNWDVVVVPPETQTPMDIRLYEGDTQTPLTDLVDDDGDVSASVDEQDKTVIETQTDDETRESVQSTDEIDDEVSVEDGLSGLFDNK